MTPTSARPPERKLLRRLVGEAWEAELHAALENLYEDFGAWAENGMSSFDRSYKIHAFHKGIARDLYKRYSLLDPEFTISRAVALGILPENAIDDSLREKLAPWIESLREMDDQ